MLSAGTLRGCIRLETSYTETNEFGEAVVSWCTLATVKASIQQMSAAQLARAGKSESQATWQAVIRWMPGLTLPLRAVWLNNPNCRVLYASSVVADDVKRESVTLSLEERDG